MTRRLRRALVADLPAVLALSAARLGALQPAGAAGPLEVAVLMPLTL